MIYPVEILINPLKKVLTEQTACMVTALPGSGKTTILPQTLLNEPWLHGKKIIMLEPRRLAAKMAAWRIAELLNEPVGKRAGYRVRLEKSISAETRLEVVTEGILTRMIQDNPELPDVGLIIFDEFHERSLHADLALALTLNLKEILRPDLRIMLMSATLDTARLSEALNAPVLSCKGSLFPVETFYTGKPPPQYEAKFAFTASTICKAWRETNGDILVFLPGMSEIRKTEQLLKIGQPLDETEIMTLHSSLSRMEQERAVMPCKSGRRKIVLSTSIAESSLTIEGITAVVDSCLERASAFFPGTGMNRLITQNASIASLDQRRGRAGRLMPGKCYRMISEHEVRALPPFAQPEILNVDLSSFLLELACWGCAANPESLFFLDPPKNSALEYARTLLKSLEAIDSKSHITPRGRKMLTAGIHPRLAHMILESQRTHAIGTACDLAAILTEQDLMRSHDIHSQTDIRLRLAALRGSHTAATDRMRTDTVRKTADDLRQRFNAPATRTVTDENHAGQCLALAFPDRIAQKRKGSDQHYLMSCGRGVSFQFPDPLNREPYLAIAAFDDHEEIGKIRMALPISESEIRTALAGDIIKKEICAWDAQRQRVTAVREEQLGKIVLHSDTAMRPSPESAYPILETLIIKSGLALLPWTPSLKEWRARITFLARSGLFNGFPDLSDEHLLQTLPVWLPDALSNQTAFSTIPPEQLKNALRTLGDHNMLVRLDEFAPLTYKVPSGSAAHIHYDAPGGPTISIRLQELFGLFESPKVAGGKIPVTLEMLSPAMRPVQVTQDLANFWKTGYFYVRKDLRGRYPKHYWPENPLEAEAIQGSFKRKKEKKT